MKTFKALLAAIFLMVEIPFLSSITSADQAIQAITHAGFGGGTDNN